MKSFISWLRTSLEEEPGRASGKSLTAFMLSIVFILQSTYTHVHNFLTHVDFTEREVSLINTTQSSIVQIILGLYLVKSAKLVANKFIKPDSIIQPNDEQK